MEKDKFNGTKLNEKQDNNSKQKHRDNNMSKKPGTNNNNNNKAHFNSKEQQQQQVARASLVSDGDSLFKAQCAPTTLPGDSNDTQSDSNDQLVAINQSNKRQKSITSSSTTSLSNSNTNCQSSQNSQNQRTRQRRQRGQSNHQLSQVGANNSNNKRAKMQQSTGATAAMSSGGQNLTGGGGEQNQQEENSSVVKKEENICAACSKPIKDRYLLMALDKQWHEDCLKCDGCDCRLGEVGSSLFTHNGNILCRRDFQRIYVEPGHCAACKRSIPPYEMVMRANQNAYHMDCFACQQCQYRFCVGDRFHLNEKDKIICILCHSESAMMQQQSSSATSKCSSSNNNTTTPLNNRHQMIDYDNRLQNNLSHNVDIDIDMKDLKDIKDIKGDDDELTAIKSTINKQATNSAPQIQYNNNNLSQEDTSKQHLLIDNGASSDNDSKQHIQVALGLNSSSGSSSNNGGGGNQDSSITLSVNTQQTSAACST